MLWRACSAAAWVRIALVLVLSLWSTAARAAPDEGTSAADRAAAQALFDEGRTLLEDEQYAQACTKFEESQRLDPAVGTQLNLGRCYELVHRTASAWINYLEAAARARKENQPSREKLARKLAAELEPTLSRLVIEVPDRVDGMEVRRDGTIVRQAQWGTAVPVDPGAHEIEVTAPGYSPWSTRVEVDDDGAMQTVRVEPLVPEPTSEAEPPAPRDPSPTPKPDAPTSDGATQRLAGWLTGAVGVAGLVVGAAAGIAAMTKNDASLEHCPDEPNRCTAEGVDLRDEAITAGTVSTVGFVLGAVAVATGAVLLLTAPADEEAAASARANEPAGPQLRVLPTLGFGPSQHHQGLPPSWIAGLTARGRF
ncbi:MAG: hypothetical protein JRI23_25855 [Deltaproteobacteria bacterium]|jgi:serine/threonine-protein kinase|nr:hypothetical protein [Deltaproteobacteria bacterium]MBW2535453.1 hypothetical protein [Deltaproteobacteria bacterium]